MEVNLHKFLTSDLDGDEESTNFTVLTALHIEKSPRQPQADWVGPRPSMNVVETEKSCLSGIKFII
jgi:hypothetical protein